MKATATIYNIKNKEQKITCNNSIWDDNGIVDKILDLTVNMLQRAVLFGGVPYLLYIILKSTI